MLSKSTKIFIAVACLIFVGLVIQAAREGKEVNTIISDAESRRHVEEAKKAITARRMAEAKQHLDAMNKFSEEWNSEGKLLWDKIGSFVIQERQKEDCRKNPAQCIKIIKHSWEKGGYDTVAIHSITLKNEADCDIADITIKFEYSSDSGTQLSSHLYTLYKVLSKGKTKTFTGLNTGFVHSQATKSTRGEIIAARIQGD